MRYVQELACERIREIPLSRDLFQFWDEGTPREINGGTASPSHEALSELTKDAFDAGKQQRVSVEAKSLSFEGTTAEHPKIYSEPRKAARSAAITRNSSSCLPRIHCHQRDIQKEALAWSTASVNC